MALVQAGNALTTKFVQPGSSYDTDGYGLLTAKATYFLDKAIGGTAIIGGQVHPQYADLFVHKFTLIRNSLDIDQVTADYVGVNSAIGTTTRPNVTASHGLTSDHITTHPNFFGPATGFTTAIAGNGTTFVTSTIDS